MTDQTESYTLGFTFSGIVLAISGLMLFAVPTLKNKKLKKQEILKTRQQII